MHNVKVHKEEQHVDGNWNQDQSQSPGSKMPVPIKLDAYLLNNKIWQPSNNIPLRL
jgi:hypothetical protein